MSQPKTLVTRIDPAPEDWGPPVFGGRELAMLAHDVRGALSGVIGGIALLDRGPMNAEMRLQFDRVAAAAESLASLVSDALATGKAGRWGEPEGVEVEDFLRYLTRRWSGEAQEKGLAFSLVAAEDLPARLKVEFANLARVLGNLIGNAIKFADAGAIRLTVRRDRAGGIVFVVQDEGPGLVEDEAIRVFEFGYRSGGAAKPGQGIGLHIAKTLTERMGGRITLSNRPEGGAEAEFALPGRLCAGRRSGAAAGPDERPDLNGLRILLAEDNPTNQMVACQMLRSMQAEVLLAADGVEALAAFEAAKVDLLIVDIEMPRKSGLEVIREIRARGDRRAGTPIVALTAYAMKEHRDKISEAGADGLISKPIVSIEAFGRAVAALAKARPAGTPEPAAEDAAEAEPLIDLATYRALAQAIGAEMMAELLDRVVADLRAAGADLRRATAPVDVVTVRAASHILISVAGAVGAMRLQNRARALNGEAHSAPSAGLKVGIEACLGEIEGVLRFVREQRAQC